VTTDTYRSLLGQLDEWFARGRRAAPGCVPCRGGCSACCHGPFDISAADADLVTDAVNRLAPGERDTVVAHATALLDRMRAIEPDWAPPYDVAAIGERRFDRLTEVLAEEPCPLLDDTGRCRIYADRPLVCRLIGLGMATPNGRVIENACPIQRRFPGYAEMPPIPFGLEEFEEEEMECLRAAALRRFGDVERWTFETTIAAAVVEGYTTAEDHRAAEDHSAADDHRASQ
jgi:Fe-S-cluster containining protein